MVEQVVLVDPDATVQEAASLMVQKKVSCLLVSGRLGAIGIVTERDILRKVTAVPRNSAKMRVKDVMSTPLIEVTMSTSIGDAAKRMVDNNVRRLVIVGEDGSLAGLVTITDLIRWVATQAELSDSLVNYLKYDVP